MTADPPYLLIAAEIRRRILAGELSPGDRVPSTRTVVREWGVAMATATKALSALRQEGLVRAVPGVGTVVTDVRPEPRTGAAPALTRDRIVVTAVRLADVEGLPALSMRRVAAELSSSTMALYRHLRSRGELIVLMADAAFAEVPQERPTGDWRAQLEASTRWLWAVHGRHPWLAQALASFTRPTVAPYAMRYTERVLTSLRSTGLAPYEMLHTHLTLFGFVQGVAMAAGLEDQARQDTGISDEEWMTRNEPQFEAIAAAGGLPVMNALFDEEDFELNMDSLFEFGLQRTLDGVAALINVASA
ncbi:TetR/AcrR family transcriptional regulator C-terminal domain-containing protein [Streptomyces beijiangensis]|uniref:TetR/AcrR family transcriptional regulator C-terminal domain-containing protein n=1 Tax=Streptomyces beijiangensis TaxID=163361 RepID=A0A939F4T3_9ACTN|nr:TetR/AcrR family transcriptional regulator C-terminal domain-containing protein [Streptomyces beijiangensis]MBO0511734.1 TetR/AcrR family transcriptional regulator C-terminal domain-containing protein [Streptomyces beijiangensis]